MQRRLGREVNPPLKPCCGGGGRRWLDASRRIEAAARPRSKCAALTRSGKANAIVTELARQPLADSLGEQGRPSVARASETGATAKTIWGIGGGRAGGRRWEPSAPPKIQEVTLMRPFHGNL